MQLARVTAKQLRHRTGPILARVVSGERVVVTLRGRPVAVLSPVRAAAVRGFEPIAFGLWKGHRDKEDVSAWLDQVRRPRHRR